MNKIKKYKLADIDNAVFLSEFRNDEIQESTEFVVASHYDELKSEFNCQCELLKMEVKRLKWLIQNMMTDINEIEEFRDA